jgi:hypothetical protein
MPGTAGPNLGLVTGYIAHESGWGLGGFNPNFDLLDALVFLGVTSAALTAPPGSPAEGDRYIVADSATGAWAGHDKDLAIYRDAAWVFHTPKTDWRAFNHNLGSYVRFDGSDWVFDSGAGLQFVDLADVNVTAVANNDLIAYDSGSSKWTNRTPTAVTALLDNLVGDTGSGGTKGLAPAPASGDAAAGKFLKADGSYAVPPGTGSASLAGDSDVTITSAANNDFLAYNSGSSKWTNRTATAATALLSNLVGDTGSGGTKGLAPAPASGDAAAGKFLKADGSWAAPTAGSSSLAGDSDVTITSAADKDFLAYDSGSSKWTNRTATSATALLTAFAGDTGSGGTKGLVPAPAAGDAAANKFLKADGTWQPPAVGIIFYSDLIDQGAWSGTTSYAAGAITTFSSKRYLCKSPVAAPNPTSGWNATYAGANWTINGTGNKAATWVSNTGSYSILAAQSQNTGKIYFEIQPPNEGVYGDPNLRMGMANSGHVQTTFLGQSTDAFAHDTASSSESWHINAATTVSGSSRIASGHWRGFAVDITNHLAWVRDCSTPSTWYGNGGASPDPATGTNGFSFSAIASDTLFPAACIGAGEGSGTFNLNIGEATLAASAPSGFTSLYASIVNSDPSVDTTHWIELGAS